MPGQIPCMEMQSFPPVVSHLPALPCAPMQRHFPCKTTSSPPVHPREHILTSSLYFWPKRDSLTTASGIILTRAFPWERVPVLPVINGVSAGSQGRLHQMVVIQVTSPSLSCRHVAETEEHLRTQVTVIGCYPLLNTLHSAMSISDHKYPFGFKAVNLPLVLVLLFCTCFSPAFQTQKGCLFFPRSRLIQPFSRAFCMPGFLHLSVLISLSSSLFPLPLFAFFSFAYFTLPFLLPVLLCLPALLSPSLLIFIVPLVSY